MALHALKIVKEEFEIGREILKSPTAEAEMVLANCEHAISERIKTECIEQPDSADGWGLPDERSQRRPSEDDDIPF